MQPPRIGVLAVIVAALVVACGPSSATSTASVAPTATTRVESATPAAEVPTTPATEAPASPSAAAAGLVVALEPYAGGLEGPLDLAVRPGDPDALYVAEQVGRIRAIRDDAVVAQPVLDIAGTVTAGGEQGLLGLAFHPDRDDGRFFVYYTDIDGQQVVSSFRLDPDDPDRALPDSEVQLLRMEDRFGNHNGGGLVFGPDGYLYIATGDGGGGGDPLGSGRSLDTLLAKILRIDVDRSAADGAAYGIPDDNPFVGRADAMPEIWHTGLRNPWRIRFDRETQDLWIGDVGQNQWEEIDRAPAGVGGLDFGWNPMEGTHCFADDDCESQAFTGPVTEYSHDFGCSVTGGTVYRGSQQPPLVGKYVFADYCSGNVWVIDAAAAADGFQDPTLVLDSGRNISAIAEDAAGELYATDLASGEVLRIVASTG